MTEKRCFYKPECCFRLMYIINAWLFNYMDDLCETVIGRVHCLVKRTLILRATAFTGKSDNLCFWAALPYGYTLKFYIHTPI